MNNFGDLINSKEPIVLCFYGKDTKDSNQNHKNLDTVRKKFLDKVKIYELDIDKNQKIADALRIKDVTTVIIYQEGKMKMREVGVKTNRLIYLLEMYQK